MSNDLATTTGGLPALPSDEGQALRTMMQIAVSAGPEGVAALERLAALHEAAMKRQAEQSFARAMQAAQDEMRPIVRNKSADRGIRYADLKKIDEEIRPIYTKHGFVLTYSGAEARQPGNVRVICKVFHRDNHSEVYELEGGLDKLGPSGKSQKTDIQGLGSTISYLRRYLAMIIFNLIMTNEDNNGAGGKISEDQEMRLREYFDQLPDARQQGFLRYAKIERLSDAPAHDFDRLLCALRDANNQVRRPK